MDRGKFKSANQKMEEKEQNYRIIWHLWGMRGAEGRTGELLNIVL